MVVCFVSMCNVSSWGEGKCLVFFLFHWGPSDWRCLRFTALRLCLCAGAAEVILLVCSPGGPSLLQTSLRMQSQSSGRTHPLSSHESRDSYPGCCCSLLTPLLLFISSAVTPTHTLAFILTFIPTQMRNNVWMLQKNPSVCLDFNLPFGFLSSGTVHTHVLMAPQPPQSSAQNSFHTLYINTKTFDLFALVFCVLLHFKHLNSWLCLTAVLVFFGVSHLCAHHRSHAFELSHCLSGVFLWPPI